MITVVSQDEAEVGGGRQSTVALSVIIVLFYSNYVPMYFLCS